MILIFLMMKRKKFKKVLDDLIIVGYDGTKIMQNIVPTLATFIQRIEELSQV